MSWIRRYWRQRARACRWRYFAGCAWLLLIGAGTTWSTLHPTTQDAYFARKLSEDELLERTSGDPNASMDLARLMSVSSNVGTFAGLLFAIGWVLRSELRLAALARPITNSDRAEALEIAEHVRSLAYDLSELEGLECALIEIAKVKAPVISRTSFGGNYRVLIPIPLLDLWAKDRRAARAILAHECAHIVQLDALLGPILNGFRRYFVFVPIIASLSLTMSLVWMVIKCSHSVTNLALAAVTIAAVFGFILISEIIVTMMLVVVWWVPYLVLCIVRRQSEYTADIFARACEGQAAVERALRWADDSNPPASSSLVRLPARRLVQLFSEYPTIDNRIRALEKLCGNDDEAMQRGRARSLLNLYFGFRGRLSISEFLLALLPIAGIYGLLPISARVLPGSVIPLASVVVWSLIAVVLKRLHDQSRSWIWFPIWPLVCLGRRTQGRNQYGLAPQSLRYRKLPVLEWLRSWRGPVQRNVPPESRSDRPVDD